MGLDSVELVMGFEEAFQIDISDSEAEKIVTVGDVVDLVEQRLKDLDLPSLPVPKSVESEKRAHFERVASIFHCNSKTNCNLKLADILPLQKRIESWKQVRAELGRVTPPLHRPTLVTIMIWLVAASCGTFIFLSSRSAFFGMLGAVSVFIAGIYMTKSLKFNFQSDIQTLGELSNHLFRKMPGSERERIQQAEFSRAAILKEVVMIVAEQLGVDESDCTEGARFIEDLGMG